MKRFIFVTFALFFARGTQAQNGYFFELWDKVETESKALMATKNITMVSEEELKKANRHWLPEVSAWGASYFTNEPGANMFGLLSQRQITQNDFLPQSLNEPGMNHFTKASVGFELPLYQGAAGVNYQRVAENLLAAEKIQSNSVKKRIYKEFIKIISNIKLIDNYLNYFSDKKSELNRLNSNYQIGNKENLLGYSGKLGMENLRLKIQSTEEVFITKKKNLLYALDQMVGDVVDREKLNLIDMTKIWESEKLKQVDEVRDETIVYEYRAKAAEASTELAKARLRPQVSFFADQTYFKGERDLTDSQTVGLSLKWSLFSSENISTESKALYGFYAAKNMHLVKVEEDKIQFSGLVNYESSLDNMTKNMAESKQILAEQSKATQKLFKNGLINILQHLEVFNQEIDLNVKMLELEEKKIDVKADKILFSKN